MFRYLANNFCIWIHIRWNYCWCLFCLDFGRARSHSSCSSLLDLCAGPLFQIELLILVIVKLLFLICKILQSFCFQALHDNLVSRNHTSQKDASTFILYDQWKPHICFCPVASFIPSPCCRFFIHLHHGSLGLGLRLIRVDWVELI